MDAHSVSLQPPKGERLAERAARKARETAAKQASDQIDVALLAERSNAKRQKRKIRVLIIGQAGSGRSTLLSNLRAFSEHSTSDGPFRETSCVMREHDATFGWVRSQEYVFYAAGGTRAMRSTPWISFLQDNIDAVIFLAPVSCFDETLLEDDSVNGLEDSLLLWNAICSTKLLEKIPKILILNKTDILQAKLQGGMRFETHIPSYDSDNDTGSVMDYLRLQFQDIYLTRSPRKSRLYIHSVSMIDAAATWAILRDVRECVPKSILERSKFLSPRIVPASVRMNNKRDNWTQAEDIQPVDSGFDEDDDVKSLSAYSLASSRTQTTDYGIYCRRMAISQESLDSEASFSTVQ